MDSIADQMLRQVVQVRPDYAGGAGVVLGHQGRTFIVTNAHVARGEPGGLIRIVLPDGRVMESRIERIDPVRDLALLAAPPITPAEPGDLAALRPGHLVLAIGHPYGIANAVSTGVVTSVGPVWGAPEISNGRGGLSWIQADIRLAPGNSGGPLCDVNGRVLGINSMIVGGLALAVPITDVLRFMTAPAPSMAGTSV